MLAAVPTLLGTQLLFLIFILDINIYHSLFQLFRKAKGDRNRFSQGTCCTDSVSGGGRNCNWFRGSGSDQIREVIKCCGCWGKGERGKCGSCRMQRRRTERQKFVSIYGNENFFEEEDETSHWDADGVRKLAWHSRGSTRSIASIAHPPSGLPG